MNTYVTYLAAFLPCMKQVIFTCNLHTTCLLFACCLSCYNNVHVYACSAQANMHVRASNMHITCIEASLEQHTQTNPIPSKEVDKLHTQLLQFRRNKQVPLALSTKTCTPITITPSSSTLSPRCTHNSRHFLCSSSGLLVSENVLYIHIHVYNMIL